MTVPVRGPVAGEAVRDAGGAGRTKDIESATGAGDAEGTESVRDIKDVEDARDVKGVKDIKGVRDARGIKCGANTSEKPVPTTPDGNRFIGNRPISSMIPDAKAPLCRRSSKSVSPFGIMEQVEDVSCFDSAETRSVDCAHA
ncbi:hypothetical protein [Streptosporangium sp. NPDC048865]|uniref:hypothetical protein n=1 Tax=Streptosporangium sp. NPDC048865 TaxID=3155766 RepID=UPI0034144A71